MKITIKGVPPSLNRTAGRQNVWEYRKTKEQWTRAVQLTCRASKERPKEPYEYALVELRYFFPTRGRHDADNYAGKYLLDGLTRAGVIVDDDLKHIRTLIVGDYDKNNPRTEITITEIKEYELWH